MGSSKVIALSVPGLKITIGSKDVFCLPVLDKRNWRCLESMLPCDLLVDLHEGCDECTAPLLQILNLQELLTTSPRARRTLLLARMGTAHRVCDVPVKVERRQVMGAATTVAKALHLMRLQRTQR